MDSDVERRARRFRFVRLAAIAFCSSLLLALGAPKDGATWAIWCGFVPLAWVATEAADLPVRQRFLLGWIGGLCVGLVGFPWIASTLVRFADAPLVLAWLGLFAFSAWTAVPLGLWVAAMGAAPRAGVRAWVWPPVLWVGLVACWPALFPYTVVIGMRSWMFGAFRALLRVPQP